MGVPKFFRYISERYPCLSEIVKEYQIPEFDNLYLDMNGIIHTCSHPDDGDPHFRITEERIFQDIFHYIEVLFRMIKPRKLFFMAVDGVAPRAKMNQQRGRRFRSIREAQALEAKARERGEVLPTDARFDSNCITPGTIFMARLHEQLKYFVTNKISTDKLWQNCKIILSGHETPGEGEHKIMDYIRYTRAQPGYDPNTRHCLYGLDADLIMLGLCTHEPHFSLLREEVKFGKKSNKRKNIPEQITFFLLHLSLMREYLELEFQPLKDNLTFEYDIEKIVDDWVLMGFLVGNDFIPNLPNMHITNGALPILYNTYMKVLPKLGGYINEAGTLNLERFEIFIQELSRIDIENFSEKYADLKWFEGKTGRRLNDKSRPLGKLKKLDIWEPEDDICLDEPLEPCRQNSDLAALIKATDDMLLDSSDLQGEELGENCDPEIESDTSDNDDSLFNAEFVQHKTDYYRNKLEYENVTLEVLRSQAEEYVRAIQWNLHYYYNGVCSWSWFYPHHYAPYVSDIKGFSNFKFSFELETPFRPYEQLLAVLPAASKSLLPEPYQNLMTDENSLIKEYYPEDFKTDLNGKRQEWEAVVLIPFIEENVLLKAMEPCNEKLTPEEKARNTHGPMLVYTYTTENLGHYDAPEYFPPVVFSHAHCQLVSMEDIRIPSEKLIKGAYPGVKFDVYYPGFPTMKHLNYLGSLEKAKVKVFEQPSKGENMILRIIDEEDYDEEVLDDMAKKLLGRTVHAGWPHLIEALVVSVSNRQYRYHTTGEKGQYNVEENKGNLVSLWNQEKQGITDYYQNRLGIDVGLTDVLVHVKVMIGRKYMFSSRGRITLEKQWADITSAYPLQTIVRDITAYEEHYAAYRDISHVFPTGSYCFMLAQPGYGVMAEVQDSSETLKEGRVKVNLKKIDEPDLTPVIQMENSIKVRYMTVHTAAMKLAISKGLFSRITGSIYIAPGSRTKMPTEDMPKVNIGLNLKFNKKNEEVPGYSKRDGGTWYYSNKAVELVSSYMEKFPWIFDYLNYNFGNDVFYEEEVFPDGDAKEMMREITTWMKQQHFYSVERQVCGSIVLDPETIKTLEQVINDYNSKNLKAKNIVLKVKPHLLYKPDLQMGNLMPDPTATFQLYDRIVNVREGYTVPLGLKGTIIGVHKPNSAKESETLYDVLFDQGFAGGLALNCSPNRGYRMPRPAIINITYGQRVYEQKTGKSGLLSATQNNENYVNSKNNYANAAAFSSNYPPSGGQFQPQTPMYGNWAYGCNYPVQPSVPLMPNQYNYNNSLYPSRGYNNSYPNPMNSNNPGPNTFVPYNKSNHFPIPALPAKYGPPLQKNNSNANTQGGYNTGRNLHQRNVNSNEGMLRNIDEKRDRKNVHGSIDVVNVQKPTPEKQPVNAISPLTSMPNQFSTVDSDMLKKMLKINEKPNDTSSSPNQKTSKSSEQEKKETSIPLSVEDIFAHARIKEQQQQPQLQKKPQYQQSTSQNVYKTALLQKEFQARNFGCPNYQYVEVNKKYMAKIILPDGMVVIGDVAKAKDLAAENVAAKTIEILKGTNVEPLPTRPPQDAVPEPPKRWHNASQSVQGQNQFSPQRQWTNSKARNATQENWRKRRETPEKHEKVGKVNMDQVHKHLNIVTAAPSEMSVEEATADQARKKNSNTNNVKNNFVPLQAVRKHKHRTSSSSYDETQKNEDTKHHKEAQSENKTVPNDQEACPQGSGGKSTSKRRERKIRIAANFRNSMSVSSCS